MWELACHTFERLKKKYPKTIAASYGTYLAAIDRLPRLGNTILVKLKLWELVIVFNKTFWSATNLCLRYASAKCGR